jgi:hypothetical protein
MNFKSFIIGVMAGIGTIAALLYLILICLHFFYSE